MHPSESRIHPLLERRNRAVPRGVPATHPIAAARAMGARLWDVDGKEYLDFTSGIGVMNVGHQHPRVVAAVQDQLQRFAHTCFPVVMYEPYLELAERLNALLGGGRDFKTMLVSTGAEAVENAVKIARAYTGRASVLAFTGGFHGRTLLGMSLTASGSGYRQNFGPFAPEIYHVPFPYEYRGGSTEVSLDALARLFATTVPADRVAAVIVEPQLGEGGFVPAPANFLAELRRLTTRHGILLIVDEIQTGFGRTGKLFGYQHSAIDPDLVAMAKSLGAGMPLAAVSGRAEIMDAPLPGGLGGTYGGNAPVCAAGLAVLDIFRDQSLVDRAVILGSRLRAGLTRLQADCPQIGDVRGLGAMLAIELVKDRASKEPDAELAQRVLDAARDRGLLLLKCGPSKNVIRFLPPLITEPADVDRALAILAAALR